MKLEKLNIIDFLKNDSILLKIAGNKIIIEIVSLTSTITGCVFSSTDGWHCTAPEEEAKFHILVDGEVSFWEVEKGKEPEVFTK